MGSYKRHIRNEVVGDKFGRLTLLKKVAVGKYPSWLCQCECGTIKTFLIHNLRNSSTSSCGCFLDEARHIPKNIKHGLTKTRIYNIWRGMKTRCVNKNDTVYRYYGGRDIKVCERWKIFQNFYSDMNKSYEKHLAIHGKKNTTLDRINNNGNYCKENCRWATLSEQVSNRRRNTLIDRYFDGEVT